MTSLPSRCAVLLKSLVGAFALFALPALAGAQMRTLDAELEPVRAKHGLPALAAAVVKGGAIIAAGAVGVRAHGTDVKVTIDDRFHLGSDTKAMTATLAAMLVEEGKLRWDSTIGEVLGDEVPGINPKLAAVTLEQLLSHSSGIPSDTPDILALYFNTDAFEYNLRPLRLRMLAAWKNARAGNAARLDVPLRQSRLHHCRRDDREGGRIRTGRS